MDFNLLKETLKALRAESRMEKFMRESNAIEGEFEPGFDEIIGRLNPRDKEAVLLVVREGIYSLEDILRIHGIIGEYLNEDWTGKWRTCQVSVGGYLPPPPEVVPLKMQAYIEKFPDMDSWEAHNEFEKIHGFQDLNGRMGRLIWLSKVIHGDEKFSSLKLPFLQAYYYQTLEHYENLRNS